MDGWVNTSPSIFKGNNMIKEIKRVGFNNWFWFVFILKRNEFSSKLNMNHYPFGQQGSIQCCRDRSRAHLIDSALSGDETISIEQINRTKKLKYA